MEGFYLAKCRLQFDSVFQTLPDGKRKLLEGWQKDETVLIAITKQTHWYTVTKLGHPIPGSLILNSEAHFNYLFEVVEKNNLKVNP